MISNIDKNNIIPVIESDAFDEGGHFAVGRVNHSVIEALQHNTALQGAAALRARTYQHYGFVREEELVNGLEVDADDERSAHFVVLERAAASGLARVIGNMRVVVKDQNYPEPLPVERFFPEHFENTPAPLGSVEASRLISMHENPRVQRLVKWPLFIAAYQFVNDHGYNSAFGLLTPKLTRELRIQGVPVTPLAEERYIGEINATKQPIEVDIPALGRAIQRVGNQGISVGSEGDFSRLALPVPGSEEKAQ